MTSAHEPSSTAVEQRTPAANSRWWWQGAIAGIVGAATLAAWFLILDVTRGKPLHTPTVLGMALRGGDVRLESLDAVPASLGLTLLFTLVHGAAFLAIGIGAAWFFARIGQMPRLALSILLLFIVLGVGFFLFVVVFARLPVDALFARDVLIGNAIAAFAMVACLMGEHPDRARG